MTRACSLFLYLHGRISSVLEGCLESRVCRSQAFKGDLSPFFMTLSDEMLQSPGLKGSTGEKSRAIQYVKGIYIAFYYQVSM